MSLPVSSYEELLVRVRNLTHETIQLRRELSSSLADPAAEPEISGISGYATHPQRTADLRRLAVDSPTVRNRSHEFTVDDLDLNGLKIGETRPIRPTTLFPKTKESDDELKDVDEKRTSPESNFQRTDWGPESLGLWHSGPSSLGFCQAANNNQESSSVISFSSSLCSGSGNAQAPRRTYSHQQLGAKVEMVYNLLSMLGTSDREDMSKTLLAMSSTAESCQAMRQSGCLPLLIQLIHAIELDKAVRARAAEALSNIVQAQTDDKRRRRETRVLKLLQTVREHSDLLKTEGEQVECDKHPGAAVAALMKFSFDAEHRQAMCTLGGLHAIAELIQLEHEAHGSTTEEAQCVTMRRYAGMALTNLTFGDGANKALLCSFTKFMEALVAQLTSPSEDLRQVTASVIRNLSWRADAPSKTNLRDVGAVTALMVAAMDAKKEATLKSILSALWNLSAHCSMNKVDICSVPDALSFLVRTLRYKASSNTLGIVENAGGILRNVSSHVAVREDYRQILREASCFEILLEQLKSPSLTVVSNACGTLWNLSARCPEDQRRLWDMGATSMLRSLVQSKHKMIAMGSSAALKNLLAANPSGTMMAHVDSTARGLGLQNLPTLLVRKQRALEQELDATLAETCENIEAEERKLGNISKRSDSKESVTSTQSDSVYERVARNSGKVLDNKDITLHDSLSDTGGTSRRVEEARLLRRCRTSGIPTPVSRKAETKGPENTLPAKPSRRGIPVLKCRLRPHSETNGPSSALRTSPRYSAEFEEEITECPVDYSLRFSEAEEGVKQVEEQSSKKIPAKPLPNVSNAYYAETDLDQPTDFSLKYGEDVSSDEDVNAQRYAYYDSNKNETEDTTRTYYTEGTPYEGTPYNFSSANSMSDLRIDSCDGVGKATLEATQKERLPTGSESLGEALFASDVSSPGQPTGMSSPLERNRSGMCTPERTYESGIPSTEPQHFAVAEPSGLCTPERNFESEIVSDDKLDVSGVSSEHPTGMCTPERNYEASVSSAEKREFVSGISSPERPSEKFTNRCFESGVSTPERPIQYCEEGTPGDCFSRVSSLSSLSGGKDSSKASPGKKDKENKKLVTFTVTETPLMFSRSSSLTSLNSLAPPLPEGDGVSSVVSTFSRITSGAISPSDLPDSPTQTVPPSVRDHRPESVFDDTMERYKVEGTPIQFSRQSSLSCLTCDQTGSSGSSVNGEDTKRKDVRSEDQTVPERNQDRLELSSVSEGDEERDDDILADCISIGMQDTRNRPRVVSKIPSKLPTRHKTASPIKPSRTVYEDSIQTYHTEDTPANISHAGSNSDLSILTAPPEQTEDASSNSSDTENILNECINSGMPQAKGNKNSLLSKVAPADGPMGHGLAKRVASIAKPQPSRPFESKRKELISAKDEVSTFATENSPCTFSTRSSLSDLTVNTDSPGPPLFRSDLNISPALNSLSQEASPSSISLIDSEDGAKRLESKRVDVTGPPSMSEDLVTALSRSLSVESFESCEPTPLEQALLEQCIHSGMPHRLKNVDGASVATAGDGAADVNAATGANPIEVMTSSVGTHTWSDDASISASLGSVSGSEDGLRVLDGPRPQFRVGSGVTLLARDATRICREIRKLQDQDLLGSVNSEYSLASCDSFLDAELSGLELPDRPTPDFLASEEHPVTLKLLKLKNDPLSVPSLGPVDADLESSMISVASITSEIVEGSDTEVPDDDLSQHSQESLPMDPSSPAPRRLTPKERRRRTQERYRTYTVEELKALCEEEEKGSIAKIAAKITPKQRRLNDRDRFLTRTISLEEGSTQQTEPIPVANYNTYRVRKEKPRAMINTLVGDNTMSHAARLELVANATLLAQTLCLDADTSISTDTYVAKPRVDQAIEVDEEPTIVDDLENDDEPKGPRVIVPEVSESPSKGVRGRRKPLYSSPKNATSALQSPKTRITGGSPSHSPSKVSRPKSAILASAAHPPGPVREGTFTKDDGKVTVKSASHPEQKTRNGIPRPGTAPPSRVKPPARSSAQNAAPARMRQNSAGHIPSQQSVNSAKRYSTPNVPTMKNSSSNQSIKSVSSAKSLNAASSTPQTGSPEKSEKNKQGATKPKTPKKEVTSKIASLWKKVEETKKKEQDKAKDTRVWIGGESTTEVEEVLVIEQEEIVELNSGKIVRSSTFQGDERSKSHDSRVRTVRNSGDFTSWEGNRGDGRVSAIVPPYNYSPPAAKPVADLKAHIPAVSSYQKKVTSV